MSELTEFLLARIAEDEAWIEKGRALGGGAVVWEEEAEARVLRECEAKRRIVEMLAGPRPQFPDWDGGAWASAWDAVEALASVYADHPDYREEWKP